jgi:hypothetical protein
MCKRGLYLHVFLVTASHHSITSEKGEEHFQRLSFISRSYLRPLSVTAQAKRECVEDPVLQHRLRSPSRLEIHSTRNECRRLCIQRRDLVDCSGSRSLGRRDDVRSCFDGPRRGYSGRAAIGREGRSGSGLVNAPCCAVTNAGDVAPRVEISGMRHGDEFVWTRV